MKTQARFFLKADNFSKSPRSTNLQNVFFSSKQTHFFEGNLLTKANYGNYEIIVRKLQIFLFRGFSKCFKKIFFFKAFTIYFRMFFRNFGFQIHIFVFFHFSYFWIFFWKCQTQLFKIFRGFLPREKKIALSKIAGFFYSCQTLTFAKRNGTKFKLFYLFE